MSYERCWFFGDDFASRSFDQHFKRRQSADYKGFGYVKSHFDVTGFFNNNFSSDNPSVISRLSNLMQFAVSQDFHQKIHPLPKLIVVVVENNLIQLFKDSGGVSSTSIACLVNHIMTEHERTITSFKENLPAKSIKQDYPHILWICPPEHENFTDNSCRFKFAKCLEEVSRLHPNVSCLTLKKVWDPRNGNLYLKESQRFTSDGLDAYWDAIDRTVRYCDSVVLKKPDKFKWKKLSTSVSAVSTVSSSTSQRTSDAGSQLSMSKNDKFRWRNPKLKTADRTPDRFGFYRRRLPSPPMLHK